MEGRCRMVVSNVDRMIDDVYAALVFLCLFTKVHLRAV